MIFRVCEHYYNDFISIENSENIEHSEGECFVCFEIKTENEYKPFQLINQNIYVKQCNCNGWIHQNCLEIWLKKSNNKCPICRKKIVKNIYIVLVYYQKVSNLIANLTPIFFILTCFYVANELFYIYLHK